MRSAGEKDNGNVPAVFLTGWVLTGCKHPEFKRLLNRSTRGVNHVVGGVGRAANKHHARTAFNGDHGSLGGHVGCLLRRVDEGDVASPFGRSPYFFQHAGFTHVHDARAAVSEERA